MEQHKAAVAAATAMKFEGVNCPTPGCDGIGHVNGSFSNSQITVRLSHSRARGEEAEVRGHVEHVQQRNRR